MFFAKTANKAIFSAITVLKCFLKNIQNGILKADFSKKAHFSVRHELCKELGITRQTLYRHVGPDGALREDGKRLLCKN